jgi:hypothetical protein
MLTLSSPSVTPGPPVRCSGFSRSSKRRLHGNTERCHARVRYRPAHAARHRERSDLGRQIPITASKDNYDATSDGDHENFLRVGAGLAVGRTSAAHRCRLDIRTCNSSPQDVRDTMPDDAALSIKAGREVSTSEATSVPLLSMMAMRDLRPLAEQTCI